jgi:UDP-N-acetylglucosamine--N-acetylmuramyl-(pentapeptide) pyrophosphoryl-undecaprenol N-acetylglucosamine transferase
VVLLAALRGIPTLLMEQNAMPGITNRLLAPVVDAAAVTYEESVRFFGTKAVVSGNPVRLEFFEKEGAHGDDLPPPGAARVLVFGGSQGAHAINMAMVEAAPRLAAGAPALAVTHQSGERDLEVVRDGYQRAGLQARVEPFLFAMDREMKSADLVVCRSGATTLAELTASARPAILIPFPGATDDHQRRNAEALARAGAARMIDQRELTGDRLAAEILALAGNEAERRRMGEAARRLAKPDATRVIVDRVLELAR